jgi:hypothetical protein
MKLQDLKKVNLSAKSLFGAGDSSGSIFATSSHCKWGEMPNARLDKGILYPFLNGRDCFCP